MARPILLRHLHPTMFKDQWLEAIAPLDPETEPDPPGYMARKFRVWFHQETDTPYALQATGEIPLLTKPDKYGNQTRYYKKVRANHQFDLGQYLCAARWMMRKDLALLEAEWRQRDPLALPTPPKADKAQAKPKQETKKKPRATYGNDEWED